MNNKLYHTAILLSIFTIAYNIIEGLVSVYFGFEDETLTLFGFGLDSFIETLSGIGVLIMILRLQKSPDSPRRPIENKALRITGISFYILATGLTATVIVNVSEGNKPQTTFWGVIISLISIVVMLWLMLAKRRTGRKLNSAPILADANCTLVCIYMSIVLLAASLIYEFTGFAYADAIGSLALVWFSYKEGRECFEKMADSSASCSCGCH
jgi:divalent metal cation (Fe/Co/Zn/Cd) transporter